MKFFISLFPVSCAAFTLLPFLLFAQPLKGYGIKIGVNSTRITLMPAALGEFAPMTMHSRNGINAAAFLEWGNFSIFSLITQAEYAQRGFIAIEAYDAEPVKQVRYDTRLDFVSLPVLLKLRNKKMQAAPYVLLGPRWDFMISCRTSRSASGYDPNIVKAIEEKNDCFLGKYNDNQAIGGVIGLGIDMNKVVPLLLEGRYNFDFTEIEYTKRKSFDVWLGIKF